MSQANQGATRSKLSFLRHNVVVYTGSQASIQPIGTCSVVIVSFAFVSFAFRSEDTYMPSAPLISASMIYVRRFGSFVRSL